MGFLPIGMTVGFFDHTQEMPMKVAVLLVRSTKMPSNFFSSSILAASIPKCSSLIVLRQLRKPVLPISPCGELALQRGIVHPSRYRPGDPRQGDVSVEDALKRYR